jgi:hypothetical protein
VVALPKGGALRLPNGASFDANAEARGETLELHRSLRLPISRVLPIDYPGFASFCRGTDALEASELVLELPSGS